MPDIHIHRDHQLGFKQARKVAFSWAEKAEEKFDMECTYEEGETEDLLTFTRSGVKGTLLVDATQFEMKAQLGFLFGAFKDRIESEIGEQLDALLNAPHPTAKKTAASSAGKTKDKTETVADVEHKKTRPKPAAKPASKARKA